jgi:Peptidase family M23
MDRTRPVLRTKASKVAAGFAAACMSLVAVLVMPAVARAQTSGWWSGDYPVTQRFGCTSFSGEPWDSGCSPPTPYFHAGVDIGLPCGTHLYAPVGATVISVGGSESYYGPYYPTIRMDGDNHDIILAHVQKTFVHPGDHLSPGQLISESGTLGNSTGCHLHFEVRPAGGRYGSAIDPMPFLNPHGQHASVALIANQPVASGYRIDGYGKLTPFGNAPTNVTSFSAVDLGHCAGNRYLPRFHEVGCKRLRA